MLRTLKKTKSNDGVVSYADGPAPVVLVAAAGDASTAGIEDVADVEVIVDSS